MIEMGYNFSVNFVIDSDFETTTGFYDEQLAGRGWEETDRTEGTVGGPKGSETSWKRSPFIPKGNPNDPDFGQAKETVTLGIYGIEPSGAAVEIFWTGFEILNKNGSDGWEPGPSRTGPHQGTGPPPWRRGGPPAPGRWR